LTRLFAGVDGGGTSTTCVISDSNGSIIGRGTGSASNYHNEGVQSAIEAIRTSLERAISNSRVKGIIQIEACVALAGLDSPKDMEIMTRAIKSIEVIPEALVVNDWRTALAGAFVLEPGVMLNAGTGSVVAGQDGKGHVIRVGGWGNIIDDRGSAYDIGKDALYAAMRHFDGRGPDTYLLGLLMKRLKVEEPQGLIERVYVQQMGVPEIASLCTLVGRAAVHGDRVAQGILEEKGEILGELVVTVASRLGMLSKPFKISLNGGVFKAGTYLIGPLKTMIRASAPLARIVRPELSPECGAILLVLEKAGLSVDRRVVARLRSSFTKLAAPAIRTDTGVRAAVRPK
jgi:N-acetylglucosamine kinase-like BadF-type ATPase